MLSIGGWKCLRAAFRPTFSKHIQNVRLSSSDKSMEDAYKQDHVNYQAICNRGSDSTLMESIPKRPIRLETPCKVRMGFIPEEWFQLFYNKTGVTGPYMFGVSLFTFLASKEIYVMEHEFYSGLSMAIMTVIIVKSIGPFIANWADREILKVEKHWQRNYEEEIQNLENAIKTEREEQWRAEGSLHLCEIKRENIDNQIEAAFREALYNVYKEAVRRLEYQVDCHHIQQRVQKKHMIQWVAKNVVENLPPMSPEAEKKAKGDMSAMCLQLK